MKISNYLKMKDNELIKEALTDTSYKKYYQTINKKEYKGRVNDNLAVLGDVVIKLALTNVFYKIGNLNITSEKQKYESNKKLVEIIGKRYKFLDIMYYDKNDKNRKKYENYNVSAKDGENEEGWKYIADAVEAVFGAIYIINNKDISIIEAILCYEFNIEFT
ncbi:MAG: ribonuclease III domain-containing protein [Methanobrevibacter sp.]|nr:ribonuclease III domain-containing protein [Methanobrevibacter sp.]